METRTWRMYNEGFLTQEPIVDIIAKHFMPDNSFHGQAMQFFFAAQLAQENRAITNLLAANKYETEKPSKYFEKLLLYGETPLTCSYFPHISIFFATYLEKKIAI